MASKAAQNHIKYDANPLKPNYGRRCLYLQLLVRLFIIKLNHGFATLINTDI